MKVAVLGSAGHYGLAAAAGAGAYRPLEFSMAPVEAGEDMGPVGRDLEGASGTGAFAGQDSRTSSGPKAYETWLDLLDRENPAVAVVNPPFHRIGAVARECLERGIHVFAEKPLATGWADYMALRGLCTSSGPKLMAMLTMRYEGAYRAAQRFVQEGGIGIPCLLTVQKSYPLQGWDGGPRPAFFRKRSSYGGSIPWIGVHAIDIIQWFSGSAFSEVYAAQTMLGNGGNDEMESAATLHFKLASGAVAAAHLDFLRQRGPGHATAVPWGDDRLRVAGEKGVLEIREGKVQITDVAGTRTLDPEPVPAMFAAFLDWVEKDEPMLLSTQDCLRAAEAALRARDAADWGRVQSF